MTIVQRMRTELTAAMKARDAVKTKFLRYWIAQLTLGSGAEMAESDAIKKMRSVQKEAKSGVTTWTAEELAMIKDWVPPRFRSSRSRRRSRRSPSRSRPRPRTAWRWESR